MEKSIFKNIRLGVFVLIGTLLLIYALYMIGSKKNMFGSTFRVNAIFHNVNGLMAGNNVRFSGIDVGTVESVNIMNDSSIKVVMVIETTVQKYIRKNALASIGTDGLMGNKIININARIEQSPMVRKDDTIQSIKPIEMDAMLRTLDRTNENIATITDNLRVITTKINSRNTLWSLLMDTVVADNVKEAIVNIKVTGKNSAEITGNLENIVKGMREGKGSVGALLTDTTISGQIHQAVVSIKITSDKAAKVTGDLSMILHNIDSGKGTMGSLIMDTTFVPNLNKSMQNIRQGSQGLNEVIEALKHSFLLRGYFKKQAKKEANKTN
jgi:phospholipid/cholesterol/gamma-HCH transport system substrate-binding protein